MLDAHPAQDFPGVDAHHQEAMLGAGPVLNAGDNLGMDVPLTSWLARVAATAGIPVQWQAKPQLKRETSVMHTTRTGTRTATLGLPCRYLGSPYQMMSQSDIDYAQQLITDALMRLAKGESLPC